ncbi:MAG TPA: efflux RND transporter periplasmic adaptor subunit [Pirellulales bacterium]|jgi:HlyD family secretion protein|nr:efflux RND transporter periplasmic adaptor subunit [Pirellulales bacterium]
MARTSDKDLITAIDGSFTDTHELNSTHTTMRIIASILVLVGLIAGGAAIYSKFIGSEPTANFRTAEITRGNLIITVNATGTLEPEEVVDVGAQIVGPVLTLGDDPRGISDATLRPKSIDYDPAFKGKHIDYGSPVDQGTVLALIDPAVYEAQYQQADANLLRSQADLGELKAKLNQAEADWKRAQVLKNIKLPNLSPTGSKLDAAGAEPIKAISDSDYDLAKANYEVAKSNVDVGEATIKQASEAKKLAEVNLGYTKIASPVKGTIVARRVDIGQTVVATFSAQSLFLIAKDLSKLQIWSSVNEADIGRIHLGMPVSFQVEAFPDEPFHGTVSQIRLNAQSNQNVVTYTVVIDADNSNLKLLPYLTTDPVKFEVERHDDALLVPNAALRWNPRLEQIAPEFRDSFKTAGGGKDTDQPGNESSEKGEKSGAATADKSLGAAAPVAKDEAKPGDEAAKTDDAAPSDDSTPKSGGAIPAEKNTAKADSSSKKGAGHGHHGKAHTEHGILWVKDGNYVRPIEVHKGDSDDQDTEVSGDGVQAGLEVVVGEIHAQDQTGETNPFAPQFFRGNRGGQKGGGAQGGGKGAK